MTPSELHKFHAISNAMSEAYRRYLHATTHAEAQRHARTWDKLYEDLNALGRGEIYVSRYRWRRKVRMAKKAARKPEARVKDMQMKPMSVVERFMKFFQRKPQAKG